MTGLQVWVGSGPVEVQAPFAQVTGAGHTLLEGAPTLQLPSHWMVPVLVWPQIFAGEQAAPALEAQEEEVQEKSFPSTSLPHPMDPQACTHQLYEEL